MMYIIADFLPVQLSLSRFTLVKSARSSHVCLNYISSFSTAQFYQSDNQNINISKQPMCTGQIFFWLIFNSTFLVAFSASRSFSADFQRTSRLSATDEGLVSVYFFPDGPGCWIGPYMPSPSTKTWHFARTLLELSQWVLNTPMHCACTW